MARKRGKSGSGSNSALLAGKLVDETGDRLTPSHANNKGRRYRYYVSNRMIRGAGENGTSETGGWRLPAKALEEQIANAVLAHLQGRLPVSFLAKPSTDEISRIQIVLHDVSSKAAAKGPKVILDCIQGVTITPGQTSIVLDPENTANCLDGAKADLNPDAFAFTTPFQFRKRGVETKLVIGNAPECSRYYPDSQHRQGLTVLRRAQGGSDF